MRGNKLICLGKTGNKQYLIDIMSAELEQAGVAVIHETGEGGVGVVSVCKAIEI